MLGRLGIAVLLAAAIAVGNAAAAGDGPVRNVIGGCTYKPRALKTPGEGRPDPARALAAAGTLRVALLYATPASIEPSESPQALYAQLAPPVERWLEAASYGRARLELEAPVQAWLPLADVSIAAATRAAGISGYDAVVVVLPHETRTAASYAEILRAGTVRYGVLLAPHPAAGSPRAPDLWTVLAHELGHVLGLPDLYGTAGNGAESVHAGPWDPMSKPLGQHLLAWHAWTLGWLDAGNVACVYSGANVARLSPASAPGGLKAVLLPQGQSVIVVEARQRAGLDSALCSAGVLVYVVELEAVPKASPVRVAAKDGRGGACGPLSHAALGPGETIKLGATTIEVLAGLRVRVTR